jgi:hypothetical protein
MRSRLSFAMVLTCALAHAQQPPSEDHPEQTNNTAAPEQPRYLAAMRTELLGMGVRESTCEADDSQRGHCVINARGVTTNRDFNVHLVYSDRTDTIYLYVDHYLAAPADADTTPAVLRRLMELNWQLLLGKFEWDSTSGEVRLAIILNTDSNFDRRAFRSAVRGIGQLADRYYAELDRLQRSGR